MRIVNVTTQFRALLQSLQLWS